jgi:YfiH family protein
MNKFLYTNQILFGTSEKSDGSMRVTFPNFTAENFENRSTFLKRHNLNHSDTVSPVLEHTKNIVLISQKDKGKIFPNTDGLITNEPGVILTVTAADCAPVFFFDPQNMAIGVAHEGWRGIEQNITKELIEKMNENFGTDPTDLLVHIGPHLRKCHFEVKEDVAEKFPEHTQKINSTLFVDLYSKMLDQFLSIGLKQENITQDLRCTHCEPNTFFSYRRDKPKEIQSFLGFIVLKNTY